MIEIPKLDLALAVLESVVAAAGSTAPAGVWSNMAAALAVSASGRRRQGIVRRVVGKTPTNATTMPAEAWLSSRD